MPLPRIKTKLILDSPDEDLDYGEIRPHVMIPKPVVEMIIDWYREFQRARIKAYHYDRFMKNYATSLFKSSSRLKLYTRELKAMGMKYRSLGENGDFNRFVQDSKRCKREYDYSSLKGIFF